MKTIEIDDELYHYIASQTQQIGESASDILRRLLMTEQNNTVAQEFKVSEKVSEAVIEPSSSNGEAQTTLTTGMQSCRDMFG